MFFGRFPAISPTDNPYILMFPHQFFESFGLIVPPPYSIEPMLFEDSNVFDPYWGDTLVLPGQPFFYQDSWRTYFVTETFAVASYVIADPLRVTNPGLVECVGYLSLIEKLLCF